LTAGAEPETKKNRSEREHDPEKWERFSEKIVLKQEAKA
jgi:hypothetical protein